MATSAISRRWREQMPRVTGPALADSEVDPLDALRRVTCGGES